MNPRWVAATEAAMNAAYVAVCLAFLLIAFPGLRHWIAAAYQAQLFRWELGTWEARWSALPPHLQEAMEVRGRRRRRAAEPQA